jgi:Coenzyme PQQ synthesis protein D (PqqD)
MGAALVVNAPHVVHETIDGEAILIHLVTGTYYSLDGVGAEMWGALARGADREALLEAANERYDGDPVEIARGVSELVAVSLADGLLIEGESHPPPGASWFELGRVPYVAPVLHTYTDMQEFMLVDPLHEVDESAGWPHAKAG